MNTQKESIEDVDPAAPCSAYLEDWAICDDTGEPKGQCSNCGHKRCDHELDALPENEQENTFLEEVSDKIRRGELVGLLESLAAIEYQRQRKLQKPLTLWKRVVRFFLPNNELSHD